MYCETGRSRCSGQNHLCFTIKQKSMTPATERAFLSICVRYLIFEQEAVENVHSFLLLYIFKTQRQGSLADP